MQAGGGANAGASVAEDVPRGAEAWLGEEECAVVCECAGLHGGVGVDDSGVEEVDAGAALRLVPAGGRFSAEASADFEARRQVEGVFDIERREECTPAELCGRWDDGEGFDVAGEEGLERRERRLSVLVLREVVVGLQPLHPGAEFELMMADGPEDVVVEGEEVAGDGVVGADVGASGGDLRAAVGCGGTGDDDGAGGLAGTKVEVMDWMSAGTEPTK